MDDPASIGLEDALAVLKFAARHADATEQKPLILGNVSVWIDREGPWANELAFTPTTAQWDVESFNGALKHYLTPCWGELMAYMRTRKVAA